MEIIAGYPCKYCNGKDVEIKKEYQYIWVHTDIILVEETTKYICKTCGSYMFIQTKHWIQKE